MIKIINDGFEDSSDGTFIADFDVSAILKEFASLGYCFEGDLPYDSVSYDPSEMVKIVKAGYGFRYDDVHDVLYYVDSKKKEVIAPDLSEGMSTSSTWLTEKLPSIPLSIDQGGNVRKGSEAVAIYKLICIACVLPCYANDVVASFKGYDFVNMVCGPNSETGNMRDFVNAKFLSQDSARIRSILSAASIKISQIKEKNVVFFNSLLTKDETLGLSNLSNSVKTIVREFDIKTGLNPNTIGDLSRVGRLTLIDERDSKIKGVIDKHQFSVLYKIKNLTSEKIPSRVKDVVRTRARVAADADVAFNKLTGLSAIDRRDYVLRKIIAEAYRAIVCKIQDEEVKKYKEKPDSYNFQPKS